MGTTELIRRFLNECDIELGGLFYFGWKYERIGLGSCAPMCNGNRKRLVNPKVADLANSIYLFCSLSSQKRLPPLISCAAN